MYALVILACLGAECKNFVGSKPLATEAQCSSEFLVGSQLLRNSTPGVIIKNAACVNWNTGEVTPLSE